MALSTSATIPATSPAIKRLVIARMLQPALLRLPHDLPANKVEASLPMRKTLHMQVELNQLSLTALKVTLKGCVVAEPQTDEQ